LVSYSEDVHVPDVTDFPTFYPITPPDSASHHSADDHDEPAESVSHHSVDVPSKPAATTRWMSPASPRRARATTPWMSPLRVTIRRMRNRITNLPSTLRVTTRRMTNQTSSLITRDMKPAIPLTCPALPGRM